MQTASGEGEGDETPNVGDSMVLGVEQVGVSNRVWEFGELVISLYLVLLFLLLTFLLHCEVCFLLALFILFLGMNISSSLTVDLLVFLLFVC